MSWQKVWPGVYLPDMQVIHGDCREVLRDRADASIDAVVTDPPYGLTAGKRGGSGAASINLDSPYGRSRIGTGNGAGGFMGQAWDSTGIAFDPAIWTEVLRVLKPGGHLLAFGGPRTFHRLTCAIEDAGFEIRDCLSWMYGTGMPKAYNLDTQYKGEWCSCDAEAEHGVRGVRNAYVPETEGVAGGAGEVLLPSLSQQGASLQGTAFERAVGGSQPGMEGRFVHRTGQGLSDDSASRAPQGKGERLRRGAPTGDGADDRPSGDVAGGGSPHQSGSGGQPAREPASVSRPPGALDDRALRGRAACSRCGGLAQEYRGFSSALKPAWEPIILARKPLIGTVASNVLVHGTGALNIDATRIATTDDLNGGAYAEVGGRSESAALHGGSGMNAPGKTTGREFAQPSGRWPANVVLDEAAGALLDEQSGVSASRQGKPRSSNKPGEGWGMTATGAEYADTGGASRFFYGSKASKSERPVVDGVAHPTVKPLDLMRWLVRMVTPPGGIVLDPFAGSGTTLEAARLEEFRGIGIEAQAEYIPLIEARLGRVEPKAAIA